MSSLAYPSYSGGLDRGAVAHPIVRGQRSIYHRTQFGG